MPEEFHRLAEYLADDVMRVVIAIGAWKNHYAKFHALILIYGGTKTQPANAWAEYFSVSFGPGTTAKINYNISELFRRAGCGYASALSSVADLRYLHGRN
jgi:hypothetical protein